MADQLIPASTLLAALDSAPSPAAFAAVVRQLLGGETPDDRRRRLTRDRVRRYRERRRSSTATLHSVTPPPARAIHSVTRVTPPASRSTPTTSTDAPQGAAGNALHRYTPHTPQALTPPSGGVSGPPRDADSVTPRPVDDLSGSVGSWAGQVRFARASAGLRARRRDWSNARCSAAVQAAVEHHDTDPADCWQALVWLAAQPGTRAPGLLKSALPRVLSQLDGGAPRTKNSARKTSRPGIAATTRSSPRKHPAPAPALSAAPRPPERAARVPDDPFQLALPLDLLSGYQQARAVCTRLFGRPPDPTRAARPYRPSRRTAVA